MDKRSSWLAGYALAVALLGSGCSEVEHCSPGEAGCIGGPCTADNECTFRDLECVTTGTATVCGEALELGYNCGDAIDCANATPVAGGGGAVPCNCVGLDQTCLPGTSDQCVNYCEDPGTVPVTVRRTAQGMLPCRTDVDGNPVGYEQACKALWNQYCMRAPVWCSGHTCDPSFVNSPAAQASCVLNFPAVEDVATACEALRGSTCESFDCTGPAPELANATPKSCANPGMCLNTCPAQPAYVNDGSCDDGDIATAGYGDCQFGTDCGDCGPRVGSPPAIPVAVGGLCVSHLQCAGYSTDYRFNESWCLEVGSTGIYRCMPDCSRGDNCGEDYRCTTLTDGAGNELMANGITAKVCDPLICM